VSKPHPRGRFAQPGGDASEQIALEIRRYLVSHDLHPGDRLGTEQELADEFGVSRPTLREALRLLASSHLVRASKGPGGGIFVASTPNEGMGRNVSESLATMLEAKSVSCSRR
jgi:GntR family transcriptional repressor for pyruvate dehydrogenase complex